MNTLKIGSKNSYDDLRLILSSWEIGFPDIKMETVDPPGANGLIDLTEVVADDVRYGTRHLSFTFWIDEDRGEWQSRASAVANYLHGRSHRIILSWDPVYYYEGRCKVSSFDTSGAFAYITIDVDAQPYKIDTTQHDVDWIWDTFSFVDGIIYPETLDIKGSLDINLPNRRKIVSPTFTPSSKMTVEYKGKSYPLPAGKPTTVLEIRLAYGDNWMTIKGTGRVTVDYRGGSL